jgi:hypothetical protein
VISARVVDADDAVLVDVLAEAPGIAEESAVAVR